MLSFKMDKKETINIIQKHTRDTVGVKYCMFYKDKAKTGRRGNIMNTLTSVRATHKSPSTLLCLWHNTKCFTFKLLTAPTSSTFWQVQYCCRTHYYTVYCSSHCYSFIPLSWTSFILVKRGVDLDYTQGTVGVCSYWDTKVLQDIIHMHVHIQGQFAYNRKQFLRCFLEETQDSRTKLYRHWRYPDRYRISP